MKKTLLEILACPGCRSPLELSVFEETQYKEIEVMDGVLFCRTCVKSYPVIEGIPRFVPNVVSQYPEFAEKYSEVANSLLDGSAGEFVKTHGSTQERFGMEWMKYPGSLPEDREIFLTETQIPESDWRGKRILDGGCGMGRYSRIAHKCGATVVALDLSRAVMRLWDLAKESEKMHLVQGNLMAPPFREKIFDTVYSIGVIHHTPSAKETFRRLADLVRPGGNLTVWVYGTAGRFSIFKTNPLRLDRKWLRGVIFPVWLIVLVREYLSDFLRLFTVHLPKNLLYALCYPLALAGKIPILKVLTFSVHPLWRVRLQENFDWLSPPYQSHHTKEELIGWFEENNFTVSKILPHGFVPKPGVLGVKKGSGK